MNFRRIAAVAVTAVLAAGAAFAQEPVRHAALDDGCRAAKESGRAVLVVTQWKEKVCNACDTWRERVGRDGKFAAAAKRFEQVDWQYDGLEGKVIPWTLANGGTSRDPTIQVFVVNPAGNVLGRCPTEKSFVPSQLTEWLEEHATAWDRAHPRIALPLKRADVAVESEGTTKSFRCAVLDEAREAGRPVLVYVGRDYEPDGADGKELKARRGESDTAREFERKVLDSKSSAEASEGWTLLRLDLWDPAHREYAAKLGVESAPGLLMFLPGAEPVVVPRTITSGELAAKLKKDAPR